MNTKQHFLLAIPFFLISAGVILFTPYEYREWFIVPIIMFWIVKYVIIYANKHKDKSSN